ncbi:2-hydroxychromene-2-carboxylate isomerase [Pseudovibrio sp. Tun.PSC04-5.I4]|uniref:2-hydroxychromene-2-carboxylate isomerase n=1 Tax=Pseudovibrio sp. Tun.PSC04-5.I4 TaxID=1798213 RepID=UPI00088C35E6|nr:2-hydroxychromene-2-carboxylate isomerase [Pseudovibrio sp. Tun.PSC04-5.I4]SDQ84345.1 2-hydroxychromene-2-carboxylate isomerase [Pseudovibrio sp. Tun.PSC04-5.I4]
MSVQIDYFYTHLSPWAFFGHQEFMRIADKHNVSVVYRPVNLGILFPLTGGLPLGKRHPARQHYRFIEMQRWSEKRGVSVNYKPAYFPTNTLLADTVGVTLQQQGGPTGTYSQKTFEAVWKKEQDIAEEKVISDILTSLDLDAAKIVATSKTPEIQEAYAENAHLAENAGVVGSPTYLLNSEPFWGQDRLELLEDALISGRAPFQTL